MIYAAAANTAARYAVDTLTRKGWRVEVDNLSLTEAREEAAGLVHVGFERDAVRVRRAVAPYAVTP